MKLTLLLLISSLCFGQTVFQAHLDSTEVSGSVVTPAVGPIGTVVKNGTGSFNFAPTPALPPGTAGGTGVYFLNCCTNTNNAYYKWTGVGVGAIFNAAQGQVVINTVSRYSWTQRKTLSGFRYVFDVQDASGLHQYGLNIQVSAGRLLFGYWVGKSVSSLYFVPVGTEDTLYGLNVPLQITLSWSGSAFMFGLNGTTVKTSTYVPPTLSWGSASTFLIGSQAFSGQGFNSCDDIIDEFTVSSSGGTSSAPPAFTSAPAASFTTGVNNSFTVTASGSPAPGITQSGALPAGVTFAGGLLSGNPSAAGSFPLVFTAVNPVGNATQNFILTTTASSGPVTFTCPVVYDPVANTLSITSCPAPASIPPSVFSTFSTVIVLPSLGATSIEWDIDAKKFIASSGTK